MLTRRTFLAALSATRDAIMTQGEPDYIPLAAEALDAPLAIGDRVRMDVEDELFDAQVWAIQPEGVMVNVLLTESGAVTHTPPWETWLKVPAHFVN